MNRSMVLGALAVIAALLAVSMAAWLPWGDLHLGAPVGPAAGDFTPAQVAREQAFHRVLRLPAFGSLAVGLVVAGLLGLTPLGARLVAAAGRLAGGGWPATVVLGSLALAVLGWLARFPLQLRTEQVLRSYGLSTQTWVGWLADAAKGWALSSLVTAAALLALVGLARAAPRTWWALAALVLASFIGIASFAYPLVVEPVFNRFTPLAAGPLRVQLLELARRDGVPVTDVLVADASRRTTALNAYVSGFGATRRIVLYDTLLATAPPEEVRLVVAHELGHAKRQDVLHGTVIGALAAAAGVCVLALVLSSPALLRRAGADGPGDPKVLALVGFLTLAGSLAVQPVGNAVSRRVEARADLHSVQLTCDLPAFVRSQQRLAVGNLSELAPPRAVYVLFFTHPSAPQRLALARAYARGHC